MAPYFYGVESLRDELRYGGLYCARVKQILANGVAGVADSDTIGGLTDVVEGLFDGSLRDFNAWTASLDAHAQGYFSEDRLAMPDMVNAYQRAYAYLIDKADRHDKTPEQYLEKLRELHLLIVEQGRGWPWKAPNYLVEARLDDRDVHLWLDGLVLVAKEIPLHHVVAVHTKHVNVAQQHLKELSIDIPVRPL